MAHNKDAKRIAIVQYETRSNADLLALMERNRAYAEAHGYTYLLRREPYADLPPHWAKVRWMEEAFLHDENVDTVLLLDSDAVVHDQTARIEDIVRRFPPDKSFLYSADCPVWDGVFNAGVILVRKPHGPRILRDWMRLYRPGRWTFHEATATWSCEGPWAGLDYEQGAFAEHMVLNKQYALHDALQRVDASFFQGPVSETDRCAPWTRSSSFTIHFAGAEHKALLRAYLRDSDALARDGACALVEDDLGEQCYCPHRRRSARARWTAALTVALVLTMVTVVVAVAVVVGLAMTATPRRVSSVSDPRRRSVPFSDPSRTVVGA